MKATKTGKYQLRAVSVACAGTRFRSTIHKDLGGFETLKAAKAEGSKQAARPEVKRASAPVRFEIRRAGKVVARTLKVEMGRMNTAGTECVGYLPKGTTYKHLVKVFGKPQLLGLSRDGKTEAEWTGTINGLTFSIYDYKSGVAAENNTDWHIGGRSAAVTSMVAARLEALN